MQALRRMGSVNLCTELDVWFDTAKEGFYGRSRVFPFSQQNGVAPFGEIFIHGENVEVFMIFSRNEATADQSHSNTLHNKLFDRCGHVVGYYYSRL